MFQRTLHGSGVAATQANLAMKERTFAKLKDPGTRAKRFRASDSLLDFLKKLLL